jgi:hypothetical protein
LRRIFLIKFVDFLIEKKIPISKDILKPISNGKICGTAIDKVVKEKKSFWQKITSFLKRYGVFIVLFVAFIFVLYCQQEVKSGAVNDIKLFSWFWNYINGISLTLGISSALAFVFSVLMPSIIYIFKKAVDQFFTDNKPLTELRISIETEERLNSPEQFERLFLEILDYINGKKIIIVFDNIDRVHGDTAIKMLATIKTFLEPKKQPNLIFIVPCDAEAIMNQIEVFYKKEKDGSSDSSEYLRKIFNLIIWTPEFIASDLRRYTKSLLSETGELSKTFENENLVSVINFAFSNNPREIKQFINNLIASFIIASETEVKNIIESNIPYLAKVLVLRQKYPDAYKRLKNKWYDPENIIEDADTKNMPGFREFMLNTSPVFVLDAEPFIYFKTPLTPSGIKDPEKIKLALINESIEECLSLMNIGNINDVLDYVTDLLQKYKMQPDILIKIFNSQLKVISQLTDSINNCSYIDTNLETIESMWAKFETFHTELVFDLLIGNTNTQQSTWRQLVLQRYISALNNDILKDGKHIQLVKFIVGGLARHFNILSADQFIQIKQSIQENFSTVVEVIELFNTQDLQNKFLTKESVIKFISSFNRANFSEGKELIISLQHAISEYKLEEEIIIKLTEVLKTETTEYPNFRPEKETFIKNVGDILGIFNMYTLFPIENESWNNFVSQLIEATNAVEGWDNRWIFIPMLRLLKSTEIKNQEIQEVVKSFFQNSSAEKIEHLLKSWTKKSIQEFIQENLDIFTSRIKDEKLLKFIYSKSLEQSRIQILKQIINELGAGCVTFIKEQKESLPNKPEIIKLLFEKGANMPFGEAVIIYHDLIPVLVNQNSAAEVKTLVSEKAIGFLKSDIPAEQDVGKAFLEADLLSKEAKREIIKELLGWLRAPGKSITSVHAIALGLIASLFEILQATLKNDFTYILFDMIRSERDHDTIKTGVGILELLSLSYKDYEKDFNDLIERLSSWPENEDRRLVIDSLKSFQKEIIKKIEELDEEKPSETIA